jgi:hypothetical protein
MKKLIIQKVCCIYPKNEYRRENNTFIKGNVHCISKDQIIEEYDDCWITLSQPIEVIGEIVNEHVYQDSYWNGHYPSNTVAINVLYNKLTPKTELLFQKPVAMEAGLYNNKPVIKAKFHLHSIIIK